MRCRNCGKVLREATIDTDGIDSYVHIHNELFRCNDYPMGENIMKEVAIPVPEEILYTWDTAEL